MPAVTSPQDAAHALRHVRQARLYADTPVPDEVLQELLQIARWTGSARNTQPWEFIVITDKEQLKKVSQVRT
ncbi:MAG: nitroreductase family protein, partial [Chloroflexia bacterium]|nr:nitroreductase family protein [Chloroflexia bacterium]